MVQSFGVYTIDFAAPNNAINQTFYENLSFDFVRDSAPIGGTMLLANVMVLNPDVPAKARRTQREHSLPDWPQKADRRAARACTS